jgi:F420H(2)-dependent quinone reductase
LGYARRTRKEYRVGSFVRFNNAVMRSLLGVGAKVGTFAILIVPGRKSGRPIQIPLVVFPYDHNRYLIASYGVVNWVRNLRAAEGRAKLRRGRRIEEISTIELPPDQAAPILRASLLSGPPGIPRLVVHIFRRFFVLPYLDVGMDSSLEEFQRSSLNHPVFLVEPPT